MEIHPYSPKDLILLDYVPNFLSTSTILGTFTVAASIVLILSWIVPEFFSKKTKTERLIICWFTLTGLIHIIIEGYFVFTPKFYQDRDGFFLAEIWKEYSKGDSRYAAYDTGIVSLELITAVVCGPACLLAAYAVATNKSYRHVIQLAVSAGQFYGILVYYISAIMEGDHFSASSFYYYAYYIGSNSPWVIIPFVLMIRSWRKICECEYKNKGKIQ